MPLIEVRCRFVALDERWFNPSIRMLTVMKLMDVIVTALAQSTRDTGLPLEEGTATVVNKVPTSSPICDHCDIFAAPRGADARPALAWLHLLRQRQFNQPNRGPGKSSNTLLRGLLWLAGGALLRREYALVYRARLPNETRAFELRPRDKPDDLAHGALQI
jgi:hypothetical protein